MYRCFKSKISSLMSSSSSAGAQSAASGSIAPTAASLPVPLVHVTTTGSPQQVSTDLVPKKSSNNKKLTSWITIGVCVLLGLGVFACLSIVMNLKKKVTELENVQTLDEAVITNAVRRQVLATMKEIFHQKSISDASAAVQPISAPSTEDSATAVAVAAAAAPHEEESSAHQQKPRIGIVIAADREEARQQKPQTEIVIAADRGEPAVESATATEEEEISHEPAAQAPVRSASKASSKSKTATSSKSSRRAPHARAASLVSVAMEGGPHHDSSTSSSSASSDQSETVNV